MKSTAAQMHAEADRIYRVIFEYAGQIGREPDRDVLLGLIAAMARDMVAADRCSVWLLDPQGQKLYTKIADGVAEIHVHTGVGLVGRCVQTGEASIVNSPATDPRFSNEIDLLTGYRTESILTVPMRGADGNIIGACQVLNKAGGFAPADVDPISFAASFSAQAIENQQLQHEREKAVRLKHELEIAREVQQRLLPPSPVTDNLDCAAICSPAFEVGGDFYNYWTLSGDKLAIALGDVSGKGISAALLMASLQAWLQGLILRGCTDLPNLCGELNRIVYNNTAPERYSSLFFAVFDQASKTLNYVNAGQTAPIVCRPGATAGERITRLTEGGFPIGLVEGAYYQQGTIAFDAGMWLLCFSDGISEAMNCQGEQWGEDNVIAALEEAGEMTASGLATHIMQAAQDFAGAAPQHDDMTVVAMHARELSGNAIEA